MAKQTECTWCWRAMSAEEAERPYTDYDGDSICDECHHEHFEFTCCLCQEYEHTDYQDDVLAVIEPVGEVQTGLYRITNPDYYTACMIGSGWLHPWALDRVADVPDGTDCGYPCGHLCRECAEKLPAARPSDSGEGV